jgi:hypothetical protein
VASRGFLTNLRGELRNEAAPLGHLLDRDAFFDQRAGWANLHAFAATGAGPRLPPGAAVLGDHQRVDATRRDIPDVGALDLVANADAARAQNAAIVVQHPTRMRDVHRQPRVVVGKPHMGHAQFLRQRLQLAVTVRDADGADMVPLDKQQLQRHQAVVSERLRVRGDRHAALRRSGAGRHQAADAGHLNQAQSAGTWGAQSLHMAERRNGSPIVCRHLENGLAFRGGVKFAVDAHRDLGHGITPGGWQRHAPPFRGYRSADSGKPPPAPARAATPIWLP